MSHVPMCLFCNEKEVVAENTFYDGSGFCSDECAMDATSDDNWHNELDWRDMQNAGFNQTLDIP